VKDNFVTSEDSVLAFSEISPYGSSFFSSSIFKDENIFCIDFD